MIYITFNIFNIKAVLLHKLQGLGQNINLHRFFNAFFY